MTSPHAVRSLIVGGTSGLGLALARESLRRGVEPVVTGRRAQGSIDIDGASVRAEPMDVTDPDSVQACIDRFKVKPSLAFRYLFYTAGCGLQGSLIEESPEQIRRVIDTSLTGYLYAVRAFMAMKGKPFHLVTVTSTTSFRVRNNETVYGAAKAGQAQAARNFHRELVARLPGSQSVVVHPGGMNTPFWDGSGVDTSKFLNPDQIAEIIWNEIEVQEAGSRPVFEELRLDRNPEGEPLISYGTPTIAF